MLDDSKPFKFQNRSHVVFKKEKCRDAARNRRGRENQEFYELAKLLPLHPEIAVQLDKASIVRLSSLEGILMILSTKRNILYISENVSTILGLSQVDMAGCDFEEYLHSKDCDRFQEYFFAAFSDINVRNINVRVKSNLSKRNTILPSYGFRVLNLSLYWFNKFERNKGAMIVLLQTLLPTGVTEINLPLRCLVILVDYSLKVLQLETKNEISNVLGLILGKSIYEYIHPLHLSEMKSCHIEVITCEQSNSSNVLWVHNAQETIVQMKLTQFLNRKESASCSILVIIHVKQ